MPLDYNQRLDELLEDNPYAAEYGIGPAAKPPSFAHLTEPLPPPQPDPTRPSEAGRPSFLHLTEPLPGTEDADPSPEIIDTPSYYGRGDANYLQKGISTAARRLTSGALNVTGGVMQGIARDPLGVVGWIPGLDKVADAVQPEEPWSWLHGAGQWAKDEANSRELAAAPGWEGGWTDTIASAVGSTIPFAAAGPAGPVVSIASGAILGSYAALDEQVQEAIRQGATPEQIRKASRLASTGGLTEPVPLEIIFNRIPLPGLAKGAVQIAGRLLAKAAAEGGQEAVQTAIQNFSENYVYNPDQDLTEGLASAFGIGAIVGTGLAVPSELAAGKAAPAPATAPGAAAVPPPGGAPAGATGVTTPAPGVTTSAGTPPPPAPGGAPGVTTPAAGVTIPASPVMTAPAPVVGGDEDALPDLEPMPEEEELPPLPEEEPVAPEPVVAPAAELPATPEQPLLPPEAPAAAPAAEQVELPFADQPGAPTGPQVGGRPAAPSAKLPATPRTPSQVQQATGVPYAEAARIAESEGWQAPPAPEAPAPEAKTGFSHLTEPIGTRRTPAPPQYAGDRVNIKASDAQRQARNAEVGHYRWQPGVNVGIEVPAAGTRRAMALPGVPQWEAQLPPGVAYGRIKGTRTRKPEIKTFIGSSPNDQVFLIDQIDPTTGKYDEPKVMLDFQSMEEARNAYISSYSDGRGAERIGSISQIPVADFRTWLKSPRIQRPFDRKATAAARRLRQAYTAEARQAEQQAKAVPDEGQAAPPAGPTPDTGQPDAAQAGVAPEQGEVQGTGQPEAEVQPQAGPVAAPDVGAFWDNLSIEARNEVAKAAGVKRSSKLAWEKIGKASQDKIRAFHTAMSPTTAGPISQPTEKKHAKTVRGDTGQAVKEDVVRPGAGARGEDLQRQAPEQPGDRAPLGEARKEEPRKEVAPKPEKEGLSNEPLPPGPKVPKYTHLGRWKHFLKRALGGQAQAYLNEQGRLRGNVEVFLAFDAKGNVLAHGHGIIDAVAMPRSLVDAIVDPANSIVLHHNHPAPISLSAPDISQVAAPGLHSIWAHGTDGTSSRASAGPDLKKLLGTLSPSLRRIKLYNFVRGVEKDFYQAFMSSISHGLTTVKEGNLYYAHIVNITLHDIGVINYESGMDAREFLKRTNLGPYMGTITRMKRAGLKLNAKPRKDRYADRSPAPLRHKGELGTAFKNAPGIAKPGGKLNLNDKAGAKNTGGQAKTKPGKPNTIKAEEQPNTLESSVGLGRRPVRPPDPGATFVEPEETRLRKAERAWAYSAEGMAQIDKALAATGAAIPEQFKLARAELLYSSRAGERGEQLKKQREEPLLKALNLLQKALGKSRSVFEDFDKYLIAQHAQTENARLRAMGSTLPNPTGMSDADAAAILASAHPDFAALAKQVYAISDETLLMQLKSGLISQEIYDELKARPGAENWVTLRGWADAEGEEGIGTGRGFDLRSPEWKMRKGRTSMADSPLAYTLQNAYTAIARSEKNRVAQVLYWMARTFKNDKVWTVDRAKKEKYKYTDKKTGAVEIRERWMPPARVDVKNTIVVRVKGIPHYISIYNKPLLVAMRNMGAEETNTLLRGMATVLRTIGKLYTTYSPNFFIVNPIRDLQTAVLQMSEEERKGLVTGTLKKMPSSWSGILQYLNGSARPPGPATTSLQYAHDFAMDGGKVSWIEMKTIEDQKRRLRRAISPNRAQKLWDATRLGTVLETMENLNGAMENAVRLALYTELRQNHGYSRAEAAKVAKEITTNFNRKGTYGPVANSLYMFFNARVQGAMRTGRFVSRVARNPRKHPVAVGALAMLPAMGFIMDMWNYAMGGDDDEGLNRWDHAVPQYEKEKSFVLLLPDGTDKVYKFPLSFGYNAFFVLGQQLSAGLRNQMGLGEGTEPVTAAFNIAHALINATSPVDIVRGGWAGIAPTLLAPAVEMGENKTYRGAPIYPTKYDPKSTDADLSFRSTPGIYKEIAQRLESLTKYDKRKPALWDWSPESFQHLANTYLGGAGQFVIDQVAGNAWKILSGKASEIEVRDIPLARALVGSTSNEFVRQNMYYEAWDQVDYLHRSMTEEGITSDEKKQLKERYPVEAGVYRDFESAEKRLREQRAKRKKIDNNPRLSSTERQRRLDAVEKKMDDIRTETLGDYAEELKRQRTGATLH